MPIFRTLCRHTGPFTSTHRQRKSLCTEPKLAVVLNASRCGVGDRKKKNRKINEFIYEQQLWATVVGYHNQTNSNTIIISMEQLVFIVTKKKLLTL